MTFESALTQLGVTTSVLTSAEREELDNRGYTRIAGVVDSQWLDRLRSEFERLSTKDVKTGTRHIEKLEEQGEIFERLCAHPKLLAATYHILERPFRLMQLGGRDPLPGFGQQGLHADWHPRQLGGPYQIVTALWLFDDFTTTNGATRLVPGTHKLGHIVPKALADPAARHKDEIVFAGKAGSLLIFNGHLWHSGTRNMSDRPRRSAQICFVACGSMVFHETRPDVLDRLEPAVRCILTGEF